MTGTGLFCRPTLAKVANQIAAMMIQRGRTSASVIYEEVDSYHRTRKIAENADTNVPKLIRRKPVKTPDPSLRTLSAVERSQIQEGKEHVHTK